MFIRDGAISFYMECELKMNPRIDAFKATDKNGYILIVESDAIKGKELSPYNEAFYRVTKNCITYLGKNINPIRQLFGEMTGYSDLPTYIQLFIDQQKDYFKDNI